MTDYYSALRALTDETWNSLNVDDKISLLQSVENEVAAREGRQPCQVTGEFIHSSDKGITLGYYNQSTRGITINTEQLVTQSKYGSDYRVHLDTILHEGRHAYQHQAVLGEIEHEDHEAAQAWADNMAPGHYISYEKNPRGYYSQPIERDARGFAREKAAAIEQEKEIVLNPVNAQEEQKTLVLARDEAELRETGMSNIEDILEVKMKRDDYTDKSIVDGSEMEQQIERDRMDLMMEFDRDAFPNQEQMCAEREDIEQLFDGAGVEAAGQDKQAMREAIDNQMFGKARAELEFGRSQEYGSSVQQDNGINR